MLSSIPSPKTSYPGSRPEKSPSGEIIRSRWLRGMATKASQAPYVVDWWQNAREFHKSLWKHSCQTVTQRYLVPFRRLCEPKPRRLRPARTIDTGGSICPARTCRYSPAFGKMIHASAGSIRSSPQPLIHWSSRSIKRRCHDPAARRLSAMTYGRMARGQGTHLRRPSQLMSKT